MTSDRGEIAAARIKSARLRAEQLRERIQRLNAGVPPTRGDVEVAKASAENQRNEALRAQERLLQTYAAADLHRRLVGSGGTGRGRTASDQVGDGTRGAPVSDRRSAEADGRTVERLSHENRRLRSALVAMAASWGGEGNGVWSKDRRRQVWRAVVEQSGDPAWRGWAHALCRAATSMMPDLRGVAVSGYDARGLPHLLAVTDEWTRQVEELHQLIGEGPAVEAYTSGSPVVVSRVSDEQSRWPGYVAAAADTGLRSVCALPVKLNGVSLGSISLYPQEEGGRGWQEWLDGTYLAAAAAKALMADLDAIEDGLDSGDLGDENIELATGMLAVQLHLNVDEALARMRAYAFSNARGLVQVADAIVDGSLRLP